MRTLLKGVGAWGGGRDLDIVGEKLYFLGDARNRPVTLYVQNADTGKVVESWGLEEYDKPTRVDARDGMLAIAAPSGLVAWLNPEDGSKIDSATIDGGLTDIALRADGSILVTTGGSVVALSREDKQPADIITGLDEPHRLSVEPETGNILLAERGDTHQVKKYSKDGKLLKTYGRAGGRRFGAYKPEDFQNVWDIEPDGEGGFFITEYQSPPRRTAHFDADGNVVKEWFGGQQFYTFAAPDPKDPTLVWMDSEWNSIMQVKVDYENRTWRPLATYRWGRTIDRKMMGTRKMARRHFVFHHDVDGDGAEDTCLWFETQEALILTVDEQAGRLRLVAAMGAVGNKAAEPRKAHLQYPIDAPDGTSAWRLTGEYTSKVSAGGSEAWLEVLNADGEPITALLFFRGGSRKGITTASGHVNYVVFNDKEVTNPTADNWQTPRDGMSMDISVKGNTARVKLNDLTLERPLLADGTPTQIRLRSIKGAKVDVKDVSFHYGDGKSLALDVEDASWQRDPVEPKAWAKAMEMLGEDPENSYVRRRHRGYTWDDADGDFEIDAEEIDLYTPDEYDGNRPFSGGPSSCKALSEDLDVYLLDKSGYRVYPATGYTKTGAPIWDWTTYTDGPGPDEGKPVEIHLGDNGSIYELCRGGGDGYRSGNVWNPAHGYAWPSNGTAGTGLVKFDPDGRMMWRVGPKAARRVHPPGQLHYPIQVQGAGHGCVAVCDKIVNPLQFWTADGLYAGSMFDRRADDGLPDRVYSWWRADVDGGNDFEANKATFQYDLALGGSLATLKDGSTVFFGAGWNNCPVYKITGWDTFKRQNGNVTLAAQATAAKAEGTGLRAEYFKSTDLTGNPAVVQTDPRVWFHYEHKDTKWPDNEATEDAFSVRWTGQVEARFTEPYTFIVYSRGGVR
ncbi:MAG: hypothetical protein ACOC9S_07400, partial [Planctomycetota bacterium]